MASLLITPGEMNYYFYKILILVGKSEPCQNADYTFIKATTSTPAGQVLKSVKLT